MAKTSRIVALAALIDFSVGGEVVDAAVSGGGGSVIDVSGEIVASSQTTNEGYGDPLPANSLNETLGPRDGEHDDAGPGSLFGVDQNTIDASGEMSEAVILREIAAMETYMNELVEMCEDDEFCTVWTEAAYDHPAFDAADTGESGCENEHPDCSLMSLYGACQENSWFMNMYCAPSCRKCAIHKREDHEENESNDDVEEDEDDDEDDDDDEEEEEDDDHDNEEDHKDDDEENDDEEMDKDGEEDDEEEDHDRDENEDAEFGSHLQRRYDIDRNNTTKPISHQSKMMLQRHDQESIPSYLRKLMEQRAMGVCSLSDRMCQIWIGRGDCQHKPELSKNANPLYATCKPIDIGNRGSSFGEEQSFDMEFDDFVPVPAEMFYFLRETELYVDLVLHDELYPGYNKHECLNFHSGCSIWALAGECVKENWAMMISECAPACRSCGFLDESSQ